MINFKNIFAIAAFTFFWLAPLSAAASTINVAPATISVYVGETFSVALGVDAGGTFAYTVKMNALFTPKIISLSTWAFDNAWMPLRQSGYDSFDNTLGTMVRTGGYPGGVTGSVNFGTATFRAMQIGKGVISIDPQSSIYDQSSQNTYTGANYVTVNVLPTVAKAAVPSLSAPHLFYIVITPSKPDFAAGEDITAVVRLTNLSSKIENLSVPVHYMLQDAKGSVVQEDQGVVLLEGINATLDYRLKVLNVKGGLYTLVTQVQYPDMAQPSESRASITINQVPVLATPIQSKNGNSSILFTIGGIIILVVLLLLLFFIVKRRKL